MRSKNRGLLSQSHDNEAAGPRTQGPEPSAARLAPRALSTGVEIFDFHDFVCELVDMGARLIESL